MQSEIITHTFQALNDRLKLCSPLSQSFIYLFSHFVFVPFNINSEVVSFSPGLTDAVIFICPGLMSFAVKGKYGGTAV